MHPCQMQAVVINPPFLCAYVRHCSPPVWGSEHTAYFWLQKFCQKENLPFRGIHALRHSFATQAILNAKVDLKTVSAILGHAQTSTTLEIYAHAIQQSNAQALDDIAALFRQESKVASK